MPQFKVDGKMVFERDMRENYTQTLEPRMQYLYIPIVTRARSAATTQPCCSRTTAACSATAPTAASTVSLPANQVSTGVTSRVYDAAAVERFNISVGQIYYFTEARTGDDNINWENNDTRGSLVWAGDTYWRIADDWGLRAGIQYDTRLDNVATGSGTVEYRRDENRLVQLNYRYASRNTFRRPCRLIPPLSSTKMVSRRWG